MESRRTEPAAHIRHGAGSVQGGEHPDPIHQQERHRILRFAEAHWTGQSGRRGILLYGAQVVLGWLVRHENQTGIRPAAAELDESPEENRFIPRPG
jgi:hypothetical protein